MDRCCSTRSASPAIAGVLVGVLPARQAGSLDVLPWLSGRRRLPDGSHAAPVRRAITIPQVAVSLVLLLTAGVYIRDLLRTELADLGYQPRNVLVGYASLRTSPAERVHMSMPPEPAARHGRTLRGAGPPVLPSAVRTAATRCPARPTWRSPAGCSCREPAERPDWSVASRGGRAAGRRTGRGARAACGRVARILCRRSGSGSSPAAISTRATARTTPEGRGRERRPGTSASGPGVTPSAGRWRSPARGTRTRSPSRMRSSASSRT